MNTNTSPLTDQSVLDQYLKPNEAFTINKRTNRGKRSLALIAKAEDDYSITVGASPRWNNEGAIRFTLVNPLVADDAVNYVRTAKPKESYGYRGSRYEALHVVLDGVWNVSEESWDVVTYASFVYSEESDDVVVETKTKRGESGLTNLNIAESIANKVAEYEEKQARIAQRDARIADLSGSESLSTNEQYAVGKAQAFVDGFSYEVNTEVRFVQDAVQNARDLAIRLVAKNIAEAFLSVVGKTTMEVSGSVGYGWRDEGYPHHVIRLDEAFGIAVHEATRQMYADSAVRDVFGFAVERFISIIR